MIGVQSPSTTTLSLAPPSLLPGECHEGVSELHKEFIGLLDGRRFFSFPGVRFHAIAVDSGVLWLNKAQQADVMLNKDLGVNLTIIDASESFWPGLAGTEDPEQKRKTIRDASVDVFEAEAAKIEAAAAEEEKKVAEAKDEVRALGRLLSTPAQLVGRHPFPGPGLAIRILGPVTRDQVKILQLADDIYIEEIRKAGLYDQIAQAFAVLLPVKAVGVMGDQRMYDRRYSEVLPLHLLIQENKIPEFDNLYLDFNGIIHNCSHPNDEDAHFRLSEERIFTSIFAYVDHLFGKIKPKKLFFMAVDGVAPRAKMNQRRSRRFRTAKEAREIREKAEAKGEKLPEEKAFDSNCIAPGTPFMARLSEQLRYFINEKTMEDSNWRDIEVVLSGHEVPGEGEHKIVEFLRLSRAQPDYNPNVRRRLYGLDADLIMLGLLNPDPRFCPLREEVKLGPSSRKKGNTRQAHGSYARQITHILTALNRSIFICYIFASYGNIWTWSSARLRAQSRKSHRRFYSAAGNGLERLFDVCKKVLPGMDMTAYLIRLQLVLNEMAQVPAGIAEKPSSPAVEPETKAPEEVQGKREPTRVEEPTQEPWQKLKWRRTKHTGAAPAEVEAPEATPAIVVSSDDSTPVVVHNSPVAEAPPAPPVQNRSSQKLKLRRSSACPQPLQNRSSLNRSTLSRPLQSRPLLKFGRRSSTSFHRSSERSPTNPVPVTTEAKEVPLPNAEPLPKMEAVPVPPVIVWPASAEPSEETPLQPLESKTPPTVVEPAKDQPAEQTVAAQNRSNASLPPDIVVSKESTEGKAYSDEKADAVGRNKAALTLGAERLADESLMLPPMATGNMAAMSLTDVLSNYFPPMSPEAALAYDIPETPPPAKAAAVKIPDPRSFLSPPPSGFLSGVPSSGNPPFRSIGSRPMSMIETSPGQVARELRMTPAMSRGVPMLLPPSSSQPRKSDFAYFPLMPPDAEVTEFGSVILNSERRRHGSEPDLTNLSTKPAPFKCCCAR
ncbi:unnamed protein product [Cyclocybe aegerita]|uniref:Xrn1 N-terminal domain-containing protein n=1 Tax=Cyclocybe aegerita TaxID=1973307 RepID=A0A8S0W1H6_CYCAE|nr:unnamed protein product [Cyclocybe aegerita]